MTRIASALIVDDARFMREVIRDALADRVDRLDEAATVDEAIAHAEAAPPDLVTLDLTLDVDEPTAGLRALARIRAAAPESRVLVVSALDQAWLRDAVRRGGAADYLTKPFDAEELRARVEALMEGVQ